MNQFQRNSVNEDAKHLIKNLPIPSFQHSLSSFASSRNQFSKVHHKTIEDSPQPHQMSLFPSNNDPSIILVDGQSTIDMTKKAPNIKHHILDELVLENNELKKTIRQLQDRLYENDKIVTQQNSSSEKKVSAQIKKLKAQITEKDKKNIQLFNVNRELVEELRLSKQEVETKTRQLNSKTIELKKQRQRNESLFKSKQSQKSDRMDEKTGQLVQQLAKREVQLRKLKNQNAILLDDINELNQKLESAKHHFLNQMRQQTNRYKFKTQQLLQRLKNQTISRSNSIRSSTVSTTSLSQSFSPEMLSPEQTVDLIFHILRKISKSQMMLKILYSNSHFVSLIQEFANKKHN